MRALTGVLSAVVQIAFVSGRLGAAGEIGPDTYGYTAAVTSNVGFINITNTGRKTLFFDDDAAVTINIGFSFNFYGVNYTTVSLNPNGLMTFGGQSTEFFNVSLATTAPGNNLPSVAVLWDDWETESVGADAIYYETRGTAGGRQFIVQWNKVMPVNGSGIDTVTFEAQLFEGSNAILFSYLDVVVADDPSYGRGAYATVGIRDIDGQLNNRNLLWSHNSPALTNGESVLFMRPNRAPIANPDFAITTEGTSTTINVLANDSDPDGNLLAVQSLTQPEHGSASINTNGMVTYTPVANFNGADSFTYSVTDGHGGSATGVVTVTVSPRPRFTSIALETNGAVKVWVQGAPETIYTLEASTNLTTWETVGAVTTGPSGSGKFEGAQAPRLPRLMYRARVPR